MAWKKSSNKKKQASRPRRRWGRRSNLRRAPARGSQGYLRVKRRVLTAGILGSTSVSGAVTSSAPYLVLGTPVSVPGLSVFDIPFAMSFKLNNLTGATEFTQLFDKYRIKNVMIKMIYNGASTYLGGQPMVSVDYLSDHDDAYVPDLLTFDQKMGIKSKVFTGRNSIMLGCNPVPSGYVLDASGTGISPAWVPGRGLWLDKAFPEIPHYGIKGVIRNAYLPGGTASNCTNIRLEATYDVEFKGVE